MNKSESKNKKCFICKIRGHFAVECPNKTSSGTLKLSLLPRYKEDVCDVCTDWCMHWLNDDCKHCDIRKVYLELLREGTYQYVCARHKKEQ
jgi:Zinc knuckle